jgi:putative ABC transport system substrate-binding protein
MSRRCRLLSALAVTLVAVSSAVEAQQAERVYRIGWLGTAPLEVQAKARPAAVVAWQAFVQGLEEHGWIEGRNIVFEFRYSGTEIERYPRLAAELVALKPDVIATGLGEPAIRALKAATTTIPIVMAVSADPVGTGLVASLARPGGNVTGLSILAPEVGGKRLELLREALPKVSRVAVLWNAAYPGKAVEFKETQRAARALKIALQSVEVRSARDFDAAFAAIVRGKPDALVALSEPLTLTHWHQIVAFATERRLPMISEIREFAEAGGLMTYGASLPALFRRAAFYVDRILRGTRPDELPVEQPTKFELVINLKTAKALGLTIPPSLLQRADHVIQ